ncbi:MAG TPA: ribosomal protein S18-alanine N-acetyltransferase [Pyrinomonadaceae bacterium]|jgi:ribosomal-protein-alanine N-acetyltransferase
MAVLDKLFSFFVPVQAEEEPEVIVPAPVTVYEVRPLTDKHLKEVLKLNLRCFKTGENYTKYTFNYLLSEPNCLSYRVVTASEQMVGFIFVMTNSDGTGHITTIGIAPEHRRRGLARQLLEHAEDALQKRRIGIVMLEVRVSNLAAQNLYRDLNYSIVQRLNKYYNNGEDGFLMVKSL